MLLRVIVLYFDDLRLRVIGYGSNLLWWSLENDEKFYSQKIQKNYLQIYKIYTQQLLDYIVWKIFWRILLEIQRPT